MTNDLLAWLRSRDWQIYPFLPPAVSLILSLYLVSVEHRLNSILQGRLASRGLQTSAQYVTAIVSDRVLQLGYLSGMLTFIATLMIVADYLTKPLFALVLMAVFVVLFFSTLHIFLAEPGDLTTTLLLRPLGKVIKTRADRYNLMLIILNVLMIALAIAGLPKRCP